MWFLATCAYILGSLECSYNYPNKIEECHKSIEKELSTIDSEYTLRDGDTITYDCVDREKLSLVMRCYNANKLGSEDDEFNSGTCFSVSY